MFCGGLVPTYLLVKDLGMLKQSGAILSLVRNVWNILGPTFPSLTRQLVEAAVMDV